MTRRQALAFVVAGALLLLGAAVSAVLERPDPVALCTQAADTYARCVDAALGHEVGALVESKRELGIAACAADPPTLAMYRHCLPEDDCARFWQCLRELTAD